MTDIICASDVYFVSADYDTTVLVAMNLKIEYEFISWFDTVKERMMQCRRIVKNTKDEFVFERRDGDGGVYSFVPLTLKLYTTKIKSRLVSGKDFLDEEAMYAAFLETKRNA